MELPAASVSLDLDNLWSYMKTHGEEEWREYPTYLDVLIPLVLDFLRDHDVHISFLVVGQDAIRPENHEPLRMIAEAGHEVGNHSFNHEPWMQEYDADAIASELNEAHAAITNAAGVEPVGFRGPGFCHSATLIRELIAMGYQWDASLLPSFIGPLARLYYFRTSSLEQEERETRSALFGTFRDGLQPLKPFDWASESGSILEIPVTTIPFVRAPFHMSYLLWLSRYSESLALAYFDIALTMCRLRGVEPSFLLHPLDFLGKDDESRLAFFPGMDMTRDQKIAFAAKVMNRLKRNFHVVSLSDHAKRIRTRNPESKSVPLNEGVPT